MNQIQSDPTQGKGQSVNISNPNNDPFDSQTGGKSKEAAQTTRRHKKKRNAQQKDMVTQL